MDKNTNPKNLKIFFIKLISICIAIIITINALFNIKFVKDKIYPTAIASVDEINNAKMLTFKDKKIIL